MGRRKIVKKLVKKPLGKRPLLRSRRKGKENLSMDAGEVVMVGAGWTWFRIPTYLQQWSSLLSVSNITV
jgi:hypothetical protein